MRELTTPCAYSPHLARTHHTLRVLTTLCMYSPHLAHTHHTLRELTTPCVYSPYFFVFPHPCKYTPHLTRIHHTLTLTLLNATRSHWGAIQTKNQGSLVLVVGSCCIDQCTHLQCCWMLLCGAVCQAKIERGMRFNVLITPCTYSAHLVCTPHISNILIPPCMS